jgi:hypothetical protein
MTRGMGSLPRLFPLRGLEFTISCDSTKVLVFLDYLSWSFDARFCQRNQVILSIQSVRRWTLYSSVHGHGSHDRHSQRAGDVEPFRIGPRIGGACRRA